MCAHRVLRSPFALLPVVALCSTISTRKPLSCSADSGLSAIEKAKRLAGHKSIDNYVQSNMVVGLGTGSTAKYAVERLGAKLATGELSNIIAIPTSIATENQARQLNIPLGKYIY